MTDRAPELTAAATLLLAAAAIGVMAGSTRRSDDETTRAGAFQRAVGGLGSGAATSFSTCGASLDRASGTVCDRALDPAPGGGAFCVVHSGPTLRR